MMYVEYHDILYLSTYLFITQILGSAVSSLGVCVGFEVNDVPNFQAPRTRAVKNVRRHACSSIIKMCRDYPEFILVSNGSPRKSASFIFFNIPPSLITDKCVLNQYETIKTPINRKCMMSQHIFSSSHALTCSTLE